MWGSAWRPTAPEPERTSDVTTFPTAAEKFESFAVGPDERYLYAGDIGGALSVIDVDAWEVVDRVQGHTGLIVVVAAHPCLPYVATMSLDRSIGLWRRDGPTLTLQSRLCVRDVVPSNDVARVPWFQSTSQALAFHPTQPRLASRSGNAGLLELSFDGGALQVDWCKRLHGEFDVVSVCYVDDGPRIMSLGGGGTLVVSEQGESVAQWVIGRFTLHHAEPMEPPWYLIAGDGRFVTRFDLSGEEEPVIGPVITRDDLECVTYNRRSGRAFIASFDRRVYEIDPKTCESLGVAFHAPFKCRWIRTLERDPSTLIVQCRNGSMLRVDLDGQGPVREIKDTPPVWWTAVAQPNGDLLLAGDGPSLGRISATSVDPSSRTAELVLETTELPIPRSTYTKRMDISPKGVLALGREDGDVLIAAAEGVRRVANVGDAVRDLAFDHFAPRLYLAVEDGTLRTVDLRSEQQSVLYRSSGSDPLPIWALAYNPTAGLLAFAERHGRAGLFSTESLTPVAEIGPAGRCKRMKWVDADTLLLNSADFLSRFRVSTGEMKELVGRLGNTIEDFIWDFEKRYLVMVNYQCNIVLADFDSGETLHVAADQMDYSKGLAWLPPDANGERYPLDFITFGRSGAAHVFRVHDEKIRALGPVAERRH